MAEENRNGRPETANSTTNTAPPVDSLQDDTGDERMLLQQMYEQSGEPRRPRE